MFFLFAFARQRLPLGTCVVSHTHTHTHTQWARTKRVLTGGEWGSINAALEASSEATALPAPDASRLVDMQRPWPSCWPLITTAQGRIHGDLLLQTLPVPGKIRETDIPPLGSDSPFLPGMLGLFSTWTNAFPVSGLGKEAGSGCD